MPRTSRQSIVSSYVHVIIQGIKKEYIFNNDNYKKEYLKLFKKISEDYSSIEILSYCIMDNHAHFLIYVEDIAELSVFMKRVNVSFGIFYNKQEERVGYVFRNRYFTQEIKSKTQLYNTLAYIHHNPVKAGMVKNLKEYQFSTYSVFKEGKVKRKIINLLFDDENYIDFFNTIHRDFNSDEIMDIKEDIDDGQLEKEIKEFCLKNKTNIEEVKANNFLLKKMVKELKSNYNITNLNIIKVLEIGKNRLYMIQSK